MNISEDPRMRPVVHLVLKAAMCHANVLLVGESGVGKTHIAECIHRASPMAAGTFHTLYCARGADPAWESRDLVDGLHSLEAVNGTVYVKCIDLLSTPGQRKLLGYLDARERRMKAPGRPGMVSARLIFSSEKNLRLESDAGRFLRQLYLRTSVVTIDVPPLRQRAIDVVSLARFFLSFYSHRERKDIRGFSGDAERVLRSHLWEGNIHELRNAMNRAVVFAHNGESVSADTLEEVLQQVAA